MHLDYSKQLELKRQRVVDAMQRIGKIDIDVKSCIPSPQQFHYRNKIQLQKGIGFYQRKSNDLIKIDHCLLHSDLGEEIYRTLQVGEVRHLLIKTTINTLQALVVLVTNKKLPKFLGEKILKSHSAIKGVVANINKRNDNVILGDEYQLLAGEDHIYEELLGLKFKVSPASFFQVNTKQAENLYQHAIKLSDLKGGEVILDAYCGVGTLSLLLAQHAKRVIGIEYVSEAIEDAKENAHLNGTTNTDFRCGAAEGLISELENIDIAYVNPPRKGCDRKFLESLVRLKPREIIYISCDPATLARDLSYLTSNGYSADELYPFDMFPQTMHVESVVNLVI